MLHELLTEHRVDLGRVGRYQAKTFTTFPCPNESSLIVSHLHGPIWLGHSEGDKLAFVVMNSNRLYWQSEWPRETGERSSFVLRGGIPPRQKDN